MTSSSGFLTLVMWLFFGLPFGILYAFSGPSAIDFMILTCLACTPDTSNMAGKKLKNTEILHDFMTYLKSEEDHQDEALPSENDNDFRGIWTGN